MLLSKGRVRVIRESQDLSSVSLRLCRGEAKAHVDMLMKVPSFRPDVDGDLVRMTDNGAPASYTEILLRMNVDTLPVALYSTPWPHTGD